MTARVANARGSGTVAQIAEPEAIALFSRGTFSQARQRRISAYIRRFKQAGLWGKIAGLWFVAAESQAQALLNWVDASGAGDLSTSGMVTFTADKGFSTLTVTTFVSGPFVPTPAEGEDWSIVFSGLINGSLTTSGDSNAQRILVDMVGSGGGPSNVALLAMQNSPTRMDLIGASRTTERLSLLKTTSYAISGETEYGSALGNSTSFSNLNAVGFRVPGPGARTGVLTRWCGSAILKGGMTQAQRHAFMRIWDALVAESGCLE
ncbi:MAG: hypothetical protein ACOY5R_10730 [Pseudomonadota bacterium]